MGAWREFACGMARRSVGREKRAMAEMCVKAVLAVADLQRKDVNLDLIKVREGERRYFFPGILDINPLQFPDGCVSMHGCVCMLASITSSTSSPMLLEQGQQGQLCRLHACHWRGVHASHALLKAPSPALLSVHRPCRRGCREGSAALPMARLPSP